jgi:hypothetical protein
LSRPTTARSAGAPPGGFASSVPPRRCSPSARGTDTDTPTRAFSPGSARRVRRSGEPIGTGRSRSGPTERRWRSRACCRAPPPPPSPFPRARNPSCAPFPLRHFRPLC